MDVDSFLGGLALTRQVASASQTAVKSVPVSTEPPPETSDLTKDITPSGIEVAYQSKPKRLYRVNGVEVPSVTTVLDILNKPALVWYGMRQGVQGVLDLVEKGVIESAFDWENDVARLSISEAWADEPLIVKALTEHKLTVNHRRDQAADRGTNVHDALEAWGVNGELPNPEDFPETERGYVQGLVKFLDDVRPIPVRQEVMVGSVEHGFAGRFDLVAHVHESEVTTRCYPKRADKRETIEAGLLLCDLKTSAQTYASHHLQLAAYERAAVECGYESTSGQYVIHVTASGQYEFVRSVARPDQFLAIKQAYDAVKELP